jgi:hypothetical protein
MAQIYGLYSVRNGEVRYVGQTIGTCKDRFKQHCRDAGEGPTTRPYKWFHSEWKDGYPIRWVLLQSCDNKMSDQIETEWIGRFPNLLNKRKNTLLTWLSYHTGKVPEIPAITAYMRAHEFNVEGRRGIHYSHQWDRYFVLVYTGRTAEWLPGDEIPGAGPEHGNIWFSDLASAENARDAYMQLWRSLNGLPRTEVRD